jgi:potassium efflux system protein
MRENNLYHRQRELSVMRPMNSLSGGIKDNYPAQRKQKGLSALRCGLCLIMLLALAPAASAQKLPFLDTKGETAPASREKVALPATEEEIDRTMAQIESRLAEIRQLSGAAAETLGSKDAGLLATPDELRKRRKVLNGLVIALDRNLDILRELKEVRKTNRERTAEIKAWQGFTDKPPFPVTFLDNLHDAIFAQRSEVQTLEVRLAVVKGDLQNFSKGLKESQKEVRLSEERLERSKGSSTEARQRWLRDMSRLENDLNEAAAASSETQRLALEEALADRREYIRFLDEKLAVAERVSPLSKADFEQKLQELDGLRRALDTELGQAQKKDVDAKKSLQRTREALTGAQRKFDPGQQPTATQFNELSRLQSLVAAQEILAETTNETVEILKGMTRLLDIAQTIWEDRYWLVHDPDLVKIREKAEQLQRTMNRIQHWEKNIQNRLAIWVTLIQSQREKVEKTDRTETERQDDRIILKAYEERQAILLRGSEYLTRIERLANRLDAEFKERQQHASLQSRLKEAVTMVWSFVKKIWNTELYVAEETVIAEGNKIVKPISVTLGKVLQALLILLAGTWIARYLVKPIRWAIMGTFGKDESAAEQVSKIVFFLLLIGVIVFSLVSVNIPLAVFAFLGGALAIGLGFGAQHLINNFISGLILLFDRSIKVGDVVEVDGEGGMVTAVGMRSSLIKRFDGVELLVPNSHFLQQKVTNRTLTDNRMRYSISIGVAYGSSTPDVSKLMLKAVQDHGLVLKDPPPVVLFEQFADSALTFSAYFWLYLEPGRDNRIILSDIRHHIATLLDKAGIVIAFPQRDVHLDASRPIEVKVVPSEDNDKDEK